MITAGVSSEEERNFCAERGIELVEGDVLPPHGVRLPLSERLKTKRRLRRFICGCLSEQGSFDAVHVHISHPWYLYMVSQEARRAGIKVRITHSHGGLPSETFPFNLTHAVYAHKIGRLATHVLACSASAGSYIYGERVWKRRGELVNNGVNTSVFFPSDEPRARVLLRLRR